MLTKRLTKFLLKRLLGKFVCDLDLDQLAVDLRSGLIHLKDIDLAIDTINDLLGSLPIRVKSGFARSVTVQVPYSHIWANNFKCRLELNYLEIAFTPNDKVLSPDNPSSKLVSSLLKELDKSKLESESESDDDEFTDGSDMALEGVEELTKLFHKLFFKVSAAITSCVLLFEFYSHERGKDVRLVLTIQSLEYGNVEGTAETAIEKTVVKIRNYRVELLERDHKVTEGTDEYSEEDETFTERSEILKGGGESGVDDFVSLQLSALHGLMGISCDLHQLTGTLSSKHVTPLLEAASVFSRSSPPPTSSSYPSDTERLGTSAPDSFRPGSIEKDFKVGSFEKSLSPHDLRAIHEMLNSQRNSRSGSSLVKLEAHEMELGHPSARERETDKEKEREKEKSSSLLSEEDYSTTTLSDDSDDDMFFECNEDIPSAVPTKDNKKESLPEFRAVVNIHNGHINMSDMKSCCNLIWKDMKVSHTSDITSVTFSSFRAEEGTCGGDDISPLFFIKMLEEEEEEEENVDSHVQSESKAFSITSTRTKKEVNVEFNFQPLHINIDHARVQRVSVLASSFLSGVKGASPTVTSWTPNIPKPTTSHTQSPSPSPPISPHGMPHHARPVHLPPSSFPHNIPGRTPSHNTSPHVSPHSSSPRGYFAAAATTSAPQSLIPLRSTPPQSFTSLRNSFTNSFPRNKVQPNGPPLSHNLLSYTSSPVPQNDLGSFLSDNPSPSASLFGNGAMPITIPMIPTSTISGFLPSSTFVSSSPARGTYYYESNEDQAVKRQITFICPTIFINVMLPGIHTGSKVTLSASNAKIHSWTFSNDDPSTPIKWFLDVHTIDAWLYKPDNTMYPLFEAQLHNTDTEGSPLLPIEITVRPRPLEVNYAWPSSFDEDDTELHEQFKHKAMESAQTVVQMVLPHTRIDVSKEHYDTFLSIFDVFASGEQPEPDSGDKAKPNKHERDPHGHVTRTTQLALVVIISNGTWTFRESPPSTFSLDSSASVATPRAHTIEFNGLKLVHVSQNVEWSVNRIGPLSGYDTFSRSAVFTSIVTSDITLLAVENSMESSILSRTRGHSAKAVFRAGFSTDNDMKTINLAFRGITVNHSTGSDWLSRLYDFFTPASPAQPTSPPPTPPTPLPALKDSTGSPSLNSSTSSAYESAKPGTQLHVDFDEVSILYVPPQPLSSRLVVFVEDLRLHVKEFSPLSMVIRSNHAKVLLWDGVSLTTTKSTAAWHEGYVTIAHHKGFELLLNKAPSFVLDITFNEFFVDLCEDSFHVLLELISNYLGLDIPLAAVADLIVSEDGQEFSGVLADALSEASQSHIFDDSTAEGSQKLYPSLDELKGNNTNNNNNNNDNNIKVLNINYQNSPALPTLQSSYGIENVQAANKRKCIIEDEDDDDLSVVNTTVNSNTNNNNNTKSMYNNKPVYNSNGDSDEEGMFLEVAAMRKDDEDEGEHKASANKQSLSDSMSSMVGSLIIDDYDPDVSDRPRESQEDNVIYVEVVPSAPATPSPSSTRRAPPESPAVPTVRWLSDEERINLIESYIDTLPPPSDTVYSLPRDYPPSVGRIALRALAATLRLHAGSHWPDLPSTEPFLSVTLMDLIVIQDTFAPKGPQASRLVINLTDIEVTDHVPTSVWHKFLCYDVDVPRMRGAPIILLELDSVRPDPQSILEEYRLRLSILPLRFNIDQDVVQFIMKFLLAGKKTKEKTTNETSTSEDIFMKTKRSSSMTTTPAKAQEMMFFQSCEIKSLRIKVDYKPKRVDFTGLRKGNYSELLNLFHLEGAVFHLTRIKANGLAGFAGIAKCVGDVWLPHIINTQVYNYVAGVRGIRSLVHVGEGMADLVLLPLEGYRDGKIIQGLKKGSSSFLKVLALETLHLGSQMAAGTQNLLESAHSMMFAGAPASMRLTSPSAAKYSLLAAQPEDTREGIAHALQSVKRELRTAAKTIIAVPIEEYSRAGPQGAVRSVIRAVPVAILRPVIGLTEGLSKVALGVRNDLASDNLKTDLKNKYKQ